ncbi:MAG: hypothetical protein WCD44_02135 [Candidatus Babeliales bacterium]
MYDSGKFTLAKAEELIDQEAKKGNDIVNFPDPGSECSPLQWLVIKGYQLNQIFIQEDQANIGQLLITHGASQKSIRKALLDCEAEAAPHRIEVNTSIRKLLHSVKTEKEVEVDEVKLERLKRFKKSSLAG